MNKFFINTKNINKYITMCFIAGIIGFFWCLYLGTGTPEIFGYSLLPLSYGLLHLFCKKIIKYEFGIGVLIFEAVAAFRYVIVPMVTCKVHYYDGLIITNNSQYSEAVLYMIIELAASYIVMYCMIPYVIRKMEILGANKPSRIFLGTFGIIKFLIIVFFLLIVISNSEIRKMLFNFSISSTSIDTNYLFSNYTSKIPNEYLLIYYIGILVIYIECLRYIGKNRHSYSWIKVLLVVILSILYMSCEWTNGNSVSRWPMLIAMLTMIYILLYFFPEKRKFVIIGGICILVAVILIGTMYKRISHGMNLSIIESFKTYLTPSYLNEYFEGAFPVGNGLSVVSKVIENRLTTFLYDTVANVPKLLSMWEITGSSSATFYGLAIGHTELIIPTLSMSYFVFGFAGTWIYTSMCVIIMLWAQTNMEISLSLYKRLMYFQLVFWSALVMAVNVQVIQASSWKYAIGLVLILLDEKYKISFSGKRILEKLHE